MAAVVSAWTAISFVIGLIIPTIVIFIITKLFGEKEGVKTAFVTAIIGAIIYSIAYFLLGNGVLAAIVGGIAWLFSLKWLYKIEWIKSTFCCYVYCNIYPRVLKYMNAYIMRARRCVNQI